MAAPLDEGYIKFQLYWKERAVEFPQEIAALMEARDEMHTRGLIGVYDNGIGFGNISIRHPQERNQFIISGSATGGHFPCSSSHFAIVDQYNISSNQVWCTGPAKASSESMTHAVIYELDASIQAVIHVHHFALWKSLLNQVPTTDESVPYGTPEMASAVQELYRRGGLQETQLLAMAGHEEGLIAYGTTLREASTILIDHLKAIN